MNGLTIVIPFFQGHQYIYRLLNSIDPSLPVVVVDDMSEPAFEPEPGKGRNLKIIRLTEKGYFSGAVNTGIQACRTDVLVLNQDTWFTDDRWTELVEEYRSRYAMFGERISGLHPAFGDLGYIHGTFMLLRRDAIDKVGLLNQKDYPLWGSTAEYQWRVARQGFDVLPLKDIPGFLHERPVTERYGSSIKALLDEMPTERKNVLVRTPPLLSVVVPCYNYGRYVSDCVGSLIGGNTSLGQMHGQTLQSLEVVIVDDASTDNSWELIQAQVSQAKGVRAYRLEKNVGTAKALNFGIEKAVGQYITFLSADDMREPESLEALVRCCQSHPHSFAYDDITLFYKDRRVKHWGMEDYDFDKLIYKNQVHAGIVFPKRAWEEAGGYPPIMNDGREDWAFNVALGVKGWCGEHVKQYGYLYRRENQNRSMTNTSPDHHLRFQRKIESIFPGIYRGERPMACCGRKPAKGAATPSIQSVNSLTAKRSVTTNMLSGGAMATGSEGMVSLLYVGTGMTSVWDGPVTNTRYSFGKDSPGPKWVDKRDAGEQGKSGFLNVKSRAGTYLFQLADTGTAQEAPSNSEPTGDVLVTVSNVSEVVEGQETATEGSVTTLEDNNPNIVEENDPTVGLSMVQAEETVDFPDPSQLTVDEVRALQLTGEQWRAVYKAELAGKNRKTLTTFIEEKLASLE